MARAPRIVPKHRKLPWLDAAVLVAANVPYVYDQCVRDEHGRKKKYRAYNPLFGMCYTASEALYHLSEDPLVSYWVKYGPEKHQTHWYLRNPAEDNRIVDLTASQYSDWDLYSLYDFGRPRPFGTTYPSKRAWLVLDRIVGSSGLFTQRFNSKGLVDTHEEYLAVRSGKPRTRTPRCDPPTG